MNSYELSRKWFNYSFDNPEKIKPIHSAIYFFAIEHCNRLGWKDKFGFPSQMVMEAIGVKNWRTYTKALNELVDFGFIEMIEKSKNQYSSNIIAIVKNTKAPTKALDKALQKHGQKQSKSTVSINKQYNKEQETIYIKENDTSIFYDIGLLKEYYLTKDKVINAVISNKKNNVKDKSDLLSKFELFNQDLLEQGKLKMNWNDYSSYFRNCLKVNKFKDTPKEMTLKDKEKHLYGKIIF